MTGTDSTLVINAQRLLNNHAQMQPILLDPENSKSAVLHGMSVCDNV